MEINFKNILSNGSTLNSNKVSLLNTERFYQDQLNHQLWGLSSDLSLKNEKSSSKRSKFKKVNKKPK